MARTRLRGLEIGGIQIGIEVPEFCEWEWPDDSIADYACLPREPEVCVGLRVGVLPDGDLGGECYGMGAWTFEIARRGSDWLLGLARGGHREQLAVFDGDFRAGEITLSRAAARRRGFPLRSPIDEWIVLHRTIARGGLCLQATAGVDEGGARLELGPPDSPVADRWTTPGAAGSLLGRRTLLVREDAGRIRVFRTPWNDALDARLGQRTPIHEISLCERSEQAYRELLDPSEAADVLVKHAIVPLCNEALLDRVLSNARRLSEAVRVSRIGHAPVADTPIPWNSVPMRSGFAPPRSAY